TFGGIKTVTIAAGTELWSDPVELALPQHADVAISVFLPESWKPAAFHLNALKTSFLSAAGDFTGATTMAEAAGNPRTTEQIFVISGLQVIAPARTKVIVALGDSITDGANSTPNTNSSWPDELSKRLPALADGTPVSVINMGI